MRFSRGLEFDWIDSAFGLDPRQTDPGGGRLVAWIDLDQMGGLPQNFLRLPFRRPASGRPEVAIESSADLTTWDPGEPHLTLTKLERDPDGIWETVEFRSLAPVVVAGCPRAYWRLKVNSPTGVRRRRTRLCHPSTDGRVRSD